MSSPVEQPQTNPAAPETAPDPTITPPPAHPEQQLPSAPPVLSGKSLLRKGFVRWMFMGGLRVLYRTWTRIAVRAFPEESRRARIAARLGIPLPDRLNMSWVTRELAVGGRVHPADIHRLALAGVGAVVDTRAEHQDDAAALAAEGIALLPLPTPDTFPLSVAQLLEGATWVNAQIASGRRVLIHCEHGVGRSVLLTAAALVQRGMSARAAINLVQRRRWQAAPNHRQMQRLQEFERVVHGQTATG
jgi:protein-tyrosine phosphatase